jgi:hypothetical protein
LCDPRCCARNRSPHSYGWEIATISPKFHPAFARGIERVSSALADHLALMLSHGGEDMDGQAVRRREVHGEKVDACFHQVGHESDIASQTIELCYDEGRTCHSTETERLKQLWSLRPRSALNLGHLVDEAITAAIQKGVDRRSLCLQTEAGSPLTRGRDAIVSHTTMIAGRVRATGCMRFRHGIV